MVSCTSKAKKDTEICQSIRGIKSIICLLGDDQLSLYRDLPSGLLEYYRAKGFEVSHIRAADHQRPALSQQHLHAVWEEYQHLTKPILVHCSAGIDRTGAAVKHILAMLRSGD
jgi:protein tyrosine/serine phosphatase